MGYYFWLVLTLDPSNGKHCAPFGKKATRGVCQHITAFLWIFFLSDQHICILGSLRSYSWYTSNSISHSLNRRSLAALFCGYIQRPIQSLDQCCLKWMGKFCSFCHISSTLADVWQMRIEVYRRYNSVWVLNSFLNHYKCLPSPCDEWIPGRFLTFSNSASIIFIWQICFLALPICLWTMLH